MPRKPEDNRMWGDEAFKHFDRAVKAFEDMSVPTSEEDLYGVTEIRLSFNGFQRLKAAWRILTTGKLKIRERKPRI